MNDSFLQSDYNSYSVYASLTHNIRHISAIVIAIKGDTLTCSQIQHNLYMG
jgi:hypothetical protein